MFAAIISRALFFYALRAGAVDAEDVAQDVIVNILKRPRQVRSNMTSYLGSAVHNQMIRRWRKGGRLAQMPSRPLDADRLVMPDLQYESIEHTDFDYLLQEFPDLVAFLLDYSERTADKRPRGVWLPGTDRARASRGRKRLREALAT